MPGMTHDRRGATSVVVAVSLVVLMGFAAISLDVAAFFNERQRLQNGADAAALAIAIDCARGTCGGASATARRYVAANTTTTTATAALLGTPTRAAGRVTVVASATTEHWFAPVLGFDSSDPSATATARWGAPVAGRAALPLAFSYCEWVAQTKGGVPSQTTVRIIKTTKGSDAPCKGPSGNIVPGGFGWIKPSGPACQVTSRVDGWIESDPGNSPPCPLETVETVQGQTVLLPLFVDATGTGNNAKYLVGGYAAFKITGYFFGSHYRYGSPQPCSGSDRCIAGYFERYVADSTAWEYGTTASDYGATVVRLTG